eukprot:Hpha_TRINITY_DN16381_c1_g4::TRINITY_DN16381_c1_g4_i1::g.61557::m.61557
MKMRCTHLVAFTLGVLEWVSRAGGQTTNTTPSISPSTLVTQPPLVPPDTYDSIPPPPPGPDRLDKNRLTILILLAALLLLGLCIVLGWVIWQRQRMAQEEKARAAQVEAMQTHLGKKHEAEQKEMEALKDKVHKLREDRQKAHKDHVLFIKKHAPDKFKRMKRSGEVVCEDGDDSEDDMSGDSQESVLRELQEVCQDHEVEWSAVTEEQMASFRPLTNAIKKERDTEKEIRRKKKERRQQVKEVALKAEIFNLEERLIEMEEKERKLEAKKLARKQESELVLDQVDKLAGGRLLQIGPGGQVIRAPGHEEGEQAPYDSDEDLSDTPSEIGGHLEDLSPRGKLLKQRAREMRQQLALERQRNEQRQNKLERDMALIRRRQEQEDRRQRGNEKKTQRELDTADNESSPPPQSVRVGNTIHHFDVPREEHNLAPRFIHSPWNVSSAGDEPRRRPSGKIVRKGGPPGTPERISPPGRRRSGSHKLLSQIATAMKREESQATPGSF